jgi:hypothetical protein
MAKQDTSKTKQILDRNITTHNARDIDGISPTRGQTLSSCFLEMSCCMDVTK